MLEAFKDLTVVKTLAKQQKLDDKIIKNLQAEMKKFTLNFISKIPHYDSKQYGDIEKLKAL